jgi:hypothetical protein
MDYIVFKSYQSRVEKLCMRMDLPIPVFDMDTPEEVMFTFVYDMEQKNVAASRLKYYKSYYAL